MSDDPGPWPVTPGPLFATSVHPTGTDGIDLLRVVGEVDLATVAALTAALDQVVTRSHRAALVDLTDMTFCSVRGYDALADASTRARGHGVGFMLLGLSSHARRMIVLGWPELTIPVPRTDGCSPPVGGTRPVRRPEGLL